MAMLVNNYYSWDYLSSFISTGNGRALMISIELLNVARAEEEAQERGGPSTTSLYYSWHVLLQHLPSEERLSLTDYYSCLLLGTAAQSFADDAFSSLTNRRAEDQFACQLSFICLQLSKKSFWQYRCAANDGTYFVVQHCKVSSAWNLTLCRRKTSPSLSLCTGSYATFAIPKNSQLMISFMSRISFFTRLKMPLPHQKEANPVMVTLKTLMKTRKMTQNPTRNNRKKKDK